MSLKVFVIAGETSGDFLAARLLEALAARSGPLTLDGIGGPELARLGLVSRFAMDELALVGLAEVVPHLPRLIRRLRQTTRAIRAARPDLVLTVDSPAFSLRVQARIGDVGAKRVHYVAPQAWAWRPGRAAELARIVDRVLFILPFEAEFFRAYGVAGVEVGHPLVERVPACDAFLRRRRGAGAATLCLLPGSRESEIRRHVPVLRDAVARLATDRPGLSSVLATLPARAAELRALTADWPTPLAIEAEPDRRFRAYARADLALAASGTVGLELALARLPTVVLYRTSPLTAALARRLIRVPHVSLLNLIAGREVVPELLQERCRGAPLAAAAARLLDDADAWRAQIRELDAIARALGAEGEPPSRRAAAAVAALLDTPN
ncbi:MAG: lipid-A-disaccharide synthase [Alphaproteobacteria bacterium]